MKVSVVISAYNGGKYICEQLDSIKNQDMSPDEVIIIDDCSSDGTAEIVKRFIEDNNLYHWKLIKNEINVGWKRNFFNGINACTGDIIFPCDQDDIWHLDKISRMKYIMEKNSDILVLEGKPKRFFDEEPHNNNLRTKVGILLDRRDSKKAQSMNTGNVYKKELDESFMKRAPGCTLAVKKLIFTKIKKYWFEDMPHDALLTYFPLLLDGYYIFDSEVIDWRQHIGSASRPKERTKEKRIQEILLDCKMIDAILTFIDDEKIDNEKRAMIEYAKKWNSARFDVVRNGRLSQIPKLLKYYKYYTQRRRILTDIKYALEK